MSKYSFKLDVPSCQSNVGVFHLVGYCVSIIPSMKRWRLWQSSIFEVECCLSRVCIQMTFEVFIWGSPYFDLVFEVFTVSPPSNLLFKWEFLARTASISSVFFLFIVQMKTILFLSLKPTVGRLVRTSKTRCFCHDDQLFILFRRSLVVILPIYYIDACI